MGRPRSELQTLLASLLPSGQKAYFQPPANAQMSYPCIVYHRDDIQDAFADNIPYNRTRRYLVTVIDENPDSGIVDSVSNLPLSQYNRSYAADNLNHDVFILYF